MELGLANKHILVTGATGGIGKAIVDFLLKEYAKVTINYVSNEKSAKKMEEKYGKENVFALQADLRNETEIQDLFAKAKGKFGRIDSLVANAGIWGENHVFTSEMSLEQWNSTLSVNLTGVFLCVKEFFRNLKEFPSMNASLVLIGSTAGYFGEAGHADYSASKAALMYGLNKTWKNEIVTFAPLGRVNSVGPGWVLTEKIGEALSDKDTLKRVLQTIPTQKIAKVSEVAQTVLFLLSDIAAGHISGETILIHGGMEGRVQYDKDDIDLSIIEALKEE